MGSISWGAFEVDVFRRLTNADELDGFVDAGFDLDLSSMYFFF